MNEKKTTKNGGKPVKKHIICATRTRVHEGWSDESPGLKISPTPTLCVMLSAHNALIVEFREMQ